MGDRSTVEMMLRQNSCKGVPCSELCPLKGVCSQHELKVAAQIWLDLHPKKIKKSTSDDLCKETKKLIFTNEEICCITDALNLYSRREFISEEIKAYILGIEEKITKLIGVYYDVK